MKYVAFCDVEDYRFENRSVAPAANDVVRYMADVFSEFDNVEIISPARTLNKKGYFKQRTNLINDKITLTLPPSFGARNSILKFLSVMQVRLWLFFYLLSNTKRGETVVVYHSLSYMKVIRLIQLIKKIKLTYEIREIYSDALPNSAFRNIKYGIYKRRELNYFAYADQYIFPTELLNDLINKGKKPYLIATGVYKSEERIVSRADDGLVHIVYAGTLDPAKGGAEFAVQAAKYLPKNYWIHILGYGTDVMIEKILDEIRTVSKLTQCKVSYEGVLYNEEYRAFLQKCHIGLSTQNLAGSFNDTSFPSKIFTYLANGLQVLSCSIRAVRDSAVGKYMFYYKSNEPICIAEEILAIPINISSANNDVLSSLDKDLRKRIIQFF